MVHKWRQPKFGKFWPPPPCQLLSDFDQKYPPPPPWLTSAFQPVSTHNCLMKTYALSDKGSSPIPLISFQLTSTSSFQPLPMPLNINFLFGVRSFVAWAKCRLTSLLEKKLSQIVWNFRKITFIGKSHISHMQNAIKTQINKKRAIEFENYLKQQYCNTVTWAKATWFLDISIFFVLMALISHNT